MSAFQDWLVLAHESEAPIEVTIEPFAIDLSPLPAEQLLVYVTEREGNLGEVHYTPTGMTVFTAEALVYQNGSPVLGLGSDSIPPPPAKYLQK